MMAFSDIIADLRAMGLTSKTLTLFFAGVGAFSPFVTFGIYWLNRKTAKKTELKELRAQWSLEIINDGLTCQRRQAQLLLQDPQINRFRLVNLRVKSPRGARLSRAGYHVENFHQALKDEGGSDRTMFLNQDAKPHGVYGQHGLTTFDYSKIPFFVSIPSKPWFIRNDLTRLVILISVEDRSSSRVQRHFIIKSQPIPWTSKNPKSTS